MSLTLEEFAEEWSVDTGLCPYCLSTMPMDQGDHYHGYIDDCVLGELNGWKVDDEVVEDYKEYLREERKHDY